MNFNHPRFIRATNYLKNTALLLLVAAITVKCDVLRDLTREPLPKAESPAPKAPNVKEANLRADIVGYAQKHQGAKYRAGGKTPETGFDCSGFTSYVMRQFDIALSASSRAQATQGNSKSIDQLEPGDLVFFRRSPQEPIFHVAMVVERSRNSLRVIHSTSRGVVIDDILTSEYWKPKIDSARDVVAAQKSLAKGGK